MKTLGGLRPRAKGIACNHERAKFPGRAVAVETEVLGCPVDGFRVQSTLLRLGGQHRIAN